MRRSSVFCNSLALAGGNVGAGALALIFTAAFARHEGPRGLGLFQFAASIASLASLVVALGLDVLMETGTGKTFTSLKLAEQLAGKGKRVLFLVPSLALLSQTLTEWTQESEMRLRSFAVCSDSDVGKKRGKDEDAVQTLAHELHYPATTQPDRLAAEALRQHDGEHMTVVFATYHSIEVVHRAQHEHGLPDFDLVICDEAHRTTGATLPSRNRTTCWMVARYSSWLAAPMQGATHQWM
jgi:restriction endonuclease